MNDKIHLYEKIYISPDGGNTVYEQNKDGTRGKLVETVKSADDYDIPAWKYIRHDYEKPILEINKIIELHEQKFTKTRDQFHKKAYETLITYMHELKAYIKKKEEDYFK